jgi:hypothetical protein
LNIQKNSPQNRKSPGREYCTGISLLIGRVTPGWRALSFINCIILRDAFFHGGIVTRSISEVDRVTTRNRFSEPPAKRIGIAATRRTSPGQYCMGISYFIDRVTPCCRALSFINCIILQSFFFHGGIVTRSISEVDRVTRRNRLSEPPAKRIGIAASQKNVTRSILHWHRHQVAYWSGDSMPEDIIFNQLPYWPGDSRPNDIIFNQLHHLRSAFFHCNIVTRSISLTRSIWYAG